LCVAFVELHEDLEAQDREYMKGNALIKLNSKTSNTERALLTITTSFEVNDDRNFFLQIYTDYQT
jgi:hypothetical protein